MNRKILAAVLVGVVACVIGLYILLTRKSVEEHLADADRYMAAGEYGLARHEYELAIDRNRQDVDTLLKFVDAASLENVESAETARRLFENMLWATSAACDKAPKNSDALQQRMDLQVRFAVGLNIAAVWGQIRERTDRLLIADPKMLTARKYRAIAAVRLADNGVPLDPAAGEDLRIWLEAHPDDVEAVHHLAWWTLLDARRLESGGQTEASQRSRHEGLQITDGARRRLSGNTQAQLNHARLLLAAGQRDQARAVVLDMDAKLLDHPGTPNEMLALAELTMQTADHNDKDDLQDAFARLESICAATSAAYPGDARADMVKTRTLVVHGQVDQAIALLDDIRQRPIRGDALSYLTQAAAHGEALSTLISLWLDRAANAANQTAKQPILDRVQGLIDEAGATMKGTLIYPQLVARFEAIRGNWFAAVESLKKADQLVKSTDPSIRLQLAAALKQTGRIEEAASILEAMIQDREPRELKSARALLIRLKIELDELDAAAQQLERLRHATPSGNEQVEQLKMILANAWASRGDRQHAEGKTIEAITSLGRALELDSESAKIRRFLATLHKAQGEHDLALEQLRLAYETDPQDQKAHHHYASYEAQHGDKQTALQLRQQWAETFPDDVENKSRLAELRSGTESDDEASRPPDAEVDAGGMDLQSTLRKARQAAAQGTTAAGRKIIEEYLRQRGDQTNAADWIALSRFLDEHAQTDRALTAAQQAVRLQEPGSTVAEREVIELLLRLDRFEEAESHLRKLYDTSPGDRSVSLNLVRVLTLRHKLDDAEEVLERLVSAHGTDVQTHMVEADIAVLRSDFPTSLERLDSAIQLAPRDPMIHLQKGRLLAQAEGQEAAARSAVERALQLDPSLTHARLLLASLLANEGQPDQAIEELQIALRADGRLDEARRRLHVLYVRSGRHDDARTLLAESARMFPDSSHWPSKLAEMARRTGDFDDEATHLKRIFELEPSPLTLRAATAALNRAGRYRQSLDLLELNPELAEIDRLLNAVRGGALAGLGQGEEAQLAFDEAAAACRTLSQATMVADHMVRALGRDEAITRLESSMHARNEVVLGLALATQELKGGNSASGLNRLKQIESRLPEHSAHRHALNRKLAMALHVAKDHEAAREAYARVIRKNPNDVVALTNLAQLLSEAMSLHEEAMQHIQTAATMAPKSPQVLYTLGCIQYRLGEWGPAEEALRRSVQISRTPWNCLHLGRVLIDRHGERSRAEALKWLQLAAKLAKQRQDSTAQNEAEKQIEALRQ